MGWLMSGLLLWIVIPSQALAQSESPPSRGFIDEKRALELMDRMPELELQGDPARTRPSGVGSSPDLVNARDAAYRSYYEYDKWYYDFQKRIYDSQHFNSRIIFWLVILLVSSGLAFSALHFYVWYRVQLGFKDVSRPSKKKGAEVSTASDQNAGTLGGDLEAGPTGLKLSTPVLGVIILGMSLLFFYLYLQVVYPISKPL